MTLKSQKRSPLCYYGGKSMLAADISMLIPKHEVYIEGFCGGASIYFHKPESKREILNDLDGHLLNFYKVVKTEFGMLRYLIQNTPHSRQAHRAAKHVLKHPEEYSAVRRAFSYWLQCNCSFAGRVFGGYAYERKGNSSTVRLWNKRKNFNLWLKKRMEKTELEHVDILTLIKRRNEENVFWLLDPPYYNSTCGTWEKYTQADFEKLLKAISTIKGKFILCSYPSESLTKATKKYGWHTLEHSRKIAVHAGVDRNKTEVITANFDVGAVWQSKCNPTKKDRWKAPDLFPDKIT